MDRREMRILAGMIIDENCRGCSYKKQYMKKQTNRVTSELDKHCNTVCQAGIKLVALGKEINKPRNDQRKKRSLHLLAMEESCLEESEVFV
ncbi:hypothetical protein [Paenibacillus gansuensis]|uniref:Zinc-finger domain-containing protein n=1 Tax=Paenibacillus gansuensis TaxID=306542 RepID=A0ABW5PGC3_9BACL